MIFDQNLAQQKAELFTKEQAFFCYKTLGSSYALDLFPDYAHFLEENKSRTLEDMEEEISRAIRQLHAASLYCW